MKIEFDTENLSGHDAVLIMKAIQIRFRLRLITKNYKFNYFEVESSIEIDDDEEEIKYLVFTTDHEEHDLGK